VRLTIAKLLSPRGATINGVGLTPDILEADPQRQLKMAVDKAAEKAAELPPSMSRMTPVVPPLAPTVAP
jgi:C-terminal processing protease CtpA/Prc